MRGFRAAARYRPAAAHRSCAEVHDLERDLSRRARRVFACRSAPRGDEVDLDEPATRQVRDADRRPRGQSAGAKRLA
jgi:hypothetical protein